MIKYTVRIYERRGKITISPRNYDGVAFYFLSYGGFASVPSEGDEISFLKNIDLEMSFSRQCTYVIPTRLVFRNDLRTKGVGDEVRR